MTKLFRVGAYITQDLFIEIEAETEEEAVKLVREQLDDGSIDGGDFTQIDEWGAGEFKLGSYAWEK
tara:strand:+ start:399 stop:596 length:198 start_codon:yes stop_codon:yes gene_type:complete